MKVMKRLSISADHPADPLAGSSAGAMSHFGQVREAPSVDKVPESLQGRFGRFAPLPPKCKILAAFPTIRPDPPADLQPAGGSAALVRKGRLPPGARARRRVVARFSHHVVFGFNPHKMGAWATDAFLTVLAVEADVATCPGTSCAARRFLSCGSCRMNMMPNVGSVDWR